MEEPKFSKEYKDKLDWLMQEASTPKLKEIIAKLYGVSEEAGKILLNLVESGGLSSKN